MKKNNIADLSSNVVYFQRWWWLCQSDSINKKRFCENTLTHHSNRILRYGKQRWIIGKNKYNAHTHIDTCVIKWSFMCESKSENKNRNTKEQKKLNQITHSIERTDGVQCSDQFSSHRNEIYALLYNLIKRSSILLWLYSKSPVVRSIKHFKRVQASVLIVKWRQCTQPFFIL